MALAEIERRRQLVVRQDKIELSELGLSLPIFDVRDLGHQEEIAGQIADGAQMAMFGGIWGGFKGVKRNTENESFFHKVKVNRPPEAKIAMMIRPQDSIKLIDWDNVHPDFRDLSEYESFRNLWGANGSYLHIIAPIRESLSSLPDVFATTPEDYAARYPNEPEVPTTTACFFWRADPYLEHLAALVKRYSHADTYIGVTSLNIHGESPAASYDEFLEQIREGKVDPTKFDLVVRDRLYEGSQALGSHTQIRLPFPHEEAKLKVLRVGVLSPSRFAESTDLPIEVMPGAKDVRLRPGINVDDELELNNAKIKTNWLAEKPRIFFRS